MSKTYSGGCQCGAVRFQVEGAPKTATICHCRMCQKAVGSYFAAFVAYEIEKVCITRGEMSVFASSNFAKRGFCSACGTPLSYQWNDRVLSISIGAFDEPDHFLPERQYAPESKVPHFDAAMAAPFVPFSSDPEELAYLDKIQNNQHPDHDTAVWPLKTL